MQLISNISNTLSDARPRLRKFAGLTFVFFLAKGLVWLLIMSGAVFVAT